MSNQLYTNSAIALDGAVLLEHASVNISRSTGSNPVMTVNKGYAGESPGSQTTEIDVTSAVPAADFEFDAGAKMKSLKEVELTVFAAGRKLVCRGFIVADSFKHSVGAEGTVDFKFRGGPSEWL